MLIREPSARDLQLFHEDSRSLFANLEQEDNVNVEYDDDLEADSTRRQLSAQEGVEAPQAVKKEDVEEVGRTVPIWTPDRNLTNLIFDTIDSAGTTGRTNYVGAE